MSTLSSGQRAAAKHPRLSAWVVPPRPPGDLLIVLTVVDDDRNGRAIASRPLPYGSARNASLWDSTLSDLGYERIGEWREVDDGTAHVCGVKLA